MEKNLLEFDHLQKLANASKQYTDSITLELINILKDMRDRISNDNILGNCDFKVNQRGVSGKISTPGYFVDRWKLVSGEVTIETDGIRLNGIIQQILENRIDGEVTASAFMNEGITSAEYDNSSKTFQIEASGQLIKMAKLEIGNRQTLARQEGGKWVLNDPPPNPVTELLKCRRYQVVIHAKSPVGIAIPSVSTDGIDVLIFGLYLRAIPTCENNEMILVTSEGMQLRYSDLNRIDYVKDANCVVLRFTGTISKPTILFVYFGSSAPFVINANL